MHSCNQEKPVLELMAEYFNLQSCTFNCYRTRFPTGNDSCTQGAVCNVTDFNNGEDCPVLQILKITSIDIL